MKLQSISMPTAVLLALSPLVTLNARALDLHNVSKSVQVAQDQGQVERGKDEKLTVFLKMHNQAEYDKAVEALYDPASPTYHKWFTDADFAKYAPTAAELKSVEDELSKHGLTVVSADPLNLSVRVHGHTENIEEAFQTQLRTLTYKNTSFQAHVTDAQLTGEAGSLVHSVVGLDRHKAVPQLMNAKNPKTGKPLFLKRVTAATVGQELANSITNVALTAPQVNVYSTPGASLPVGVYYGLGYDAAFSNKVSKSVAFTPKQLQAHYGLTSLIKQGYDGTGQTIALVEAYGYAQAKADANLAAQTFGLPLLTASNFKEVFADGVPTIPNIGIIEGWNAEIALDIQSAHSIAPGAKIVEVVADGQDDEDFLSALNYVIVHKLAHTVSNSWELSAEFVEGPAEGQAFNAVLERGAASGISFQFSTGDGGDNGLGSPVGDVGIPADSPYATAVGGTSVLNNPNGGKDIVTGWGTIDTSVYDFGTVDPPNATLFFSGGAGGGESVYFSKPSWQKGLPGSGRQLPDVSALADPVTGFPIIFTSFDSPFGEEVSQFAAVYGGTSLASPIFTATWAIADQYNGKPLGLAAPLVAKLKPSDITDVLATNPIEVSDVTGTVYDSKGATYYSARELFENASSPVIQPEFVSALFSSPEVAGEAYAIAFGQDSSLTVGPGWDNVTGYGEPNGLPFIQGVTGKTVGAPLVK